MTKREKFERKMLSTFLLRRKVLATFLNPNNSRFAARSDVVSVEEAFRERINSFSASTLKALMTASSDPDFKFSIRIARLSEPMIRDVCAITDMLGAYHTMSYPKQIDDAFTLIYSLGLDYIPGNLLHSGPKQAAIVRALILLIDSAPGTPRSLHPSIVTMLKDEPDSWQEIANFSAAQKISHSNVHAEQIIEHRRVNVDALQGGIL